MTTITNKDIEKIAKLSRIEVAQHKKEQLAEQLGSIITWVEALNEVNTENVAPITNVHEMTMPMDKDVVSDGNKLEEVLKNAPNAKYNYFTVPKVIE